MVTRNRIRNVLGIVLLLGGAAASVQAASPETAACVFDKYAPVAVRPYYTADEQQISIAYGPDNYFRGVELYVPAHEGLTKEWLIAVTQSSLASSSIKGSPQSTDLTCGPSKVKNVQVSAVSAGGGFWVRLIVQDEGTAAQVLRWAQGLVKQQTQTHAAKR